MMNLKMKCGGKVVASMMVVENRAIAFENTFFARVLMGPDYFGTAPLQDDQMVVPCWHGYKEKGDLQLQLGWSGVVGCQVMVIFPLGYALSKKVDGWLMANFGCMILVF